MRTSRLLGRGVLVAALAVGTLSVAQTRPRVARLPIKSEDKLPAPVVLPIGHSAPATGPVDAGPWSPSRFQLPSDGGRLSPLNPDPAEFSDAGGLVAPLDYDRLLSDLASLRTRVAAVSDTLFHSRIAISLEASGEHARIDSLSVSLDDGLVWLAPARFRPSDAATIYDHPVAPGQHAVTIEVERRDVRNDAFRSSERSRFLVDVPADHRLSVELRLWDDSSMGGDFPNDKRGQFDLRIRASVKAQPVGR